MLVKILFKKILSSFNEKKGYVIKNYHAMIVNQNRFQDKEPPDKKKNFFGKSKSEMDSKMSASGNKIINNFAISLSQILSGHG